jgi:hypothetical protein
VAGAGVQDGLGGLHGRKKWRFKQAARFAPYDTRVMETPFRDGAAGIPPAGMGGEGRPGGYLQVVSVAFKQTNNCERHPGLHNLNSTDAEDRVFRLPA